MKRLALLLLAFTGLMSACSKDDPVPQDGPLTPDSPEGREAVTIPDEFLCSYLLKYFDLDRNGELSRYEASLVVRIDCPGNIVFGGKDYMCDATGIEACTNLHYLNLSGNDLTKLDVSNNKLLDTLDCSMNYNLKSLDISQNKNLLQLHCYACSLEIERWDLSANPELKDLRIGGDGFYSFSTISVLDCSNNHKLESLMAGQSQMSELYLDCPELNLVDLELNNLSSLDFSNCTKLTTLNIAQNKITHLDLQCPDLDLLRCESNNLTALDVSNCPKLNVLYCNDNQLQELDLTNNKEIEYLHVSNNKIQNLDLTNLTILHKLDCSNIEITNLHLNSPELTQLICTNCNLQKLEFLNVPNLSAIECQNNNLQSLDLSNLPALYLLKCYENQLETIDVSNNPELRGFFCNPMESLKTIYLNEGQDQLLRAFEKPEAAEVVYK